jgi:hypothetical protein
MGVVCGAPSLTQCDKVCPHAHALAVGRNYHPPDMQADKNP